MNASDRHERPDPPGCIWSHGGRLWWRGKLPGKTARKPRAIKRECDRYALPDSPANREIAKMIVWRWWEDAAREAGTDGLVAPLATVAEVVAAYEAHAEIYYRRPDGTPTGEIHNIRYAVRLLLERHGSAPADMLRQRDIKSLREQMIADDLARRTINQRINIIKRMLRWAAEEEIVPPSVWHAAQVVSVLKPGRSAARETAPIGPADPVSVEVTLEYLPRTTAAMVRLQLLAGLRSTELCTMTPARIDRTGDIWIYEPEWHKTMWRGHRRLVPFGPRAQDILYPFVRRADDVCCFTSGESLAQMGRPVRRGLAECYDHKTYYRAIMYGIARARAAGLEVAHWSPHRLRHSFLTNVGRQFGVEVARVMGGHASLSATEIYLERDIAAAVSVAREIG